MVVSLKLDKIYREITQTLLQMHSDFVHYIKKKIIFYRTGVTLCAGHAVERNPQPTPDFPQNLWRRSQRREMTTCYPCDLNVIEKWDENLSPCDEVYSFTDEMKLLLDMCLLLFLIMVWFALKTSSQTCALSNCCWPALCVKGLLLTDQSVLYSIHFMLRPLVYNS